MGSSLSTKPIIPLLGNKRVCIIGEPGSGKSSLFMCILHGFDCYFGINAIKDTSPLNTRNVKRGALFTSFEATLYDIADPGNYSELWQACSVLIYVMDIHAVDNWSLSRMAICLSEVHETTSVVIAVNKADLVDPVVQVDAEMKIQAKLSTELRERTQLVFTSVIRQTDMKKLKTALKLTEKPDVQAHFARPGLFSCPNKKYVEDNVRSWEATV